MRFTRARSNRVVRFLWTTNSYCIGWQHTCMFGNNTLRFARVFAIKNTCEEQVQPQRLNSRQRAASFYSFRWWHVTTTISIVQFHFGILSLLHFVSRCSTNVRFNENTVINAFYLFSWFDLFPSEMRFELVLFGDLNSFWESIGTHYIGITPCLVLMRLIDALHCTSVKWVSSG